MAGNGTAPGDVGQTLWSELPWEPDTQEGMTRFEPADPPEDPPPRPEDPGEAWEARGPPPEPVRESADAYLVEWFGEDFFASHVRLDENETRHLSMAAFCNSGTKRCDRWGWRDYHVLAYNVTPPGVNASVEFTLPVAPDGTVVAADLWGVPDCVEVPEECRFQVSREDAVERARAAGLGEGLRPWRVEFTWYREHVWPEGPAPGNPMVIWGTYAWRVTNTSSVDPGSGVAVMVDANDGKVQLADRWFTLDLPGSPEGNRTRNGGG